MLVEKKMFKKIIVRFRFDVDVYEKSEPIPREDLLKRIQGKAAVLCMLTDKVDADVLNIAGKC